MKNYTKKYYIGIESGIATVLSDVEITQKQYYNMITDAEKNMKFANDGMDDKEQFTEKLVYDLEDYGTYTKQVTRYMSAGSAMYLTILACKEGYCFKR